MKNSLRAVNDRYEDAEDEPPPVRVVVAEGAEDVCIKVGLLVFWHACAGHTCLREVGSTPARLLAGLGGTWLCRSPPGICSWFSQCCLPTVCVPPAVHSIMLQYESCEHASRCAEQAHTQALQVSDEGGGIPRSGLSRIWTYLYSTAHSPLEEMAKDGGDGADGPAVLAGYGYGLPISRLYARYFGGDLQVHPVHAVPFRTCARAELPLYHTCYDVGVLGRKSAVLSCDSVCQCIACYNWIRACM